MFKAEEIFKLFNVERKGSQEIKRVVTDSRKADKDSLFVALIGENMDGHKFISSAFDNGCPLAIASYIPKGLDSEKIILVDDTRDALLKIAGLYRRKFSIPLVGITGSVGKTTTREFVSLVMKKKFKLLKNEENLNNEIGVSHTLFNLDDSYGACCMEMGMDGLGQIEKISEAACPNIAVITNIGISHLEKLKTRENILKAKTEILKPMKKGSPLVLCKDNDLLDKYKNDDYRIISYGIKEENADVRAKNIVLNGKSTEFDVASPFGNFKCSIPTVGEHNVLNALAALTVGNLLGISNEDMVSALKDYEAVGLRQKEIEKNGIKYVADCYNASPDSLIAASGALSSVKTGGKKYMVVSDMLELGESERELHRDCGVKMSELDIDCILGTGALTKSLTEGAENKIKALYFEDKESLAQYIKDVQKEGDIFWFKASRGMKLEDVLEKIL